MRLRLTRAGRSADAIVTLPDGSTPLASVLLAAGVDPVPVAVVIDGHPARTTAHLDALGLHDGSTIVMDPPTAPAPETPVRLVQVAGARCGRSVPLPVGLHDLGPVGPTGRVETPVVRLGVESSGSVTVATVGRGSVRLDGLPLAGPALEPVGSGMHLATADALFRVGPGRAVRATLTPPVGLGGRIRYQRRPRSAVPPDPAPPTPPERPRTSVPASPLSWAMVLAPIPVAVVMALVLNPHFLIFAAFTPLLAIARWGEGSWRQRRLRRSLAAGWARAMREYEIALTGYAADRAAGVRAAHPDLAALLDTARVGGPGLWALRPGVEGYLELPVGYGDRPGGWTAPAATEADAFALAVRYRRLPDVPIGLDLSRHAAMAVVGPDAADLAATTLVQAAATHGPAHLQLAVVCDPDRLDRWDWLKWLPHLDDAAGRRTVATTAAEVAALFDSAPTAPGATAHSRVDPTPEGPVRVVVVDSDRLLDAVLAGLFGAPDRARSRLCVVAATADRLPAICTHVAVRHDGRVSVTDLADAVTVRGVLPVAADRRTVSELARALARFVDPEATRSGASLPTTIDLAHVLGAGLGAEALAARWAQAGPELLATLGATEDGPLVVDLIADGPHMLVAGTTGSGKSELLRTLVASLACRYGPDRVNVVLVDFKGGGAFDACVDLPHTVGVVTDLDEQLAARALRCLRAELRHRERVLRAGGVSDLIDLRGPDTPARLVLVIDEFATLAAELPDFMGSLVDIAQRGRSLGIHLVLATQRPSGVVDSKIRANTNLRLALRVQSDADSFDVLASPVASRIGRRTPGRGYAMLGAGELRAFQTALVSTHTASSGPTAVQVEPFSLGGPGPAPTPIGPTPAGLLTDLQLIIAASRTGSAGLPPARVPWPAPLPDHVEAEPLWATASPAVDTVQLGIVDRPDQQRVDPFGWNLRRGPLLAYGSDAKATTGVIVTAAADLVRRFAADALHLYLFDFTPGSGLERVSGLPHVAVRVGPSDHELLLRTVDLLETELDRRREAQGSGGPRPLIMIGIAGYHHALSVAEELGRLDLPGRLERLVAEGSALGVATVLTTHHERGVPGRLASQIPARIAFRLADHAAYTSFGLRPRAVPNLQGDRAVDLATGEEVVIATPTMITSAGVGLGGPRRVLNLAERIPAAAITGHSRRDGAVWRLALGLRHSDLAPAHVTLHPGNHLVVTGGPASGRTTALRTLCGSLRDCGPAEVRVLTSRPEEWWERDVVIGPDGLAAPVEQPTLVIVDGLDAAATVDVRLTILADDPRVRIVVADRIDAFRLPATWLRRVLSARAGVLLQPQPDHGDLLRVRLPLRSPVAPLPGRGYLVENGFAELVQVALPEEAGSDRDSLATTASLAE